MKRFESLLDFLVFVWRVPTSIAMDLLLPKASASPREFWLGVGTTCAIRFPLFVRNTSSPSSTASTSFDGLFFASRITGFHPYIGAK